MKKLILMLAAVVAFYAAPALAQPASTPPATPFQATAVSGKPVALASFAGKYVVLEWFSTSCPFVAKHYSSGNMQATQVAALAKGVVWLSINSDARDPADSKGKSEVLAWMSAKRAAPTEIILDSTGSIGLSYGAKTTPHMVVINPQGKVIYTGAMDSMANFALSYVSNGSGKPPSNYITTALDEAMSGKPVSQPRTKPFGCGIKYAG